jgi:hypothetical protein
MSKYGAKKSMAFCELMPLIDSTDASLISLQVGPERRDQYPPVMDVLPDDPTWADTAALIECLDLVITVDTGVGHLAGAMGKPVWLLLPFEAEWRWMTAREDSPWYPTMRLFRPVSPGNWPELLDRVARQF